MIVDLGQTVFSAVATIGLVIGLGLLATVVSRDGQSHGMSATSLLWAVVFLATPLGLVWWALLTFSKRDAFEAYLQISSVVGLTLLYGLVLTSIVGVDLSGT